MPEPRGLPAVPEPVAAPVVRAGLDRCSAVAMAFLLGYQGHTRRAYETDLADWARWCAGHGLDPLHAQRAHVDAYARELAERRHLSPSTVARRLSTLAGFYGYAAAEGLLDRSPVTHVRRPRVGHDSQTTGLDRQQAEALRRAAAASSPRDHALVTLLVMNGLRISEALGADVPDLGSSRGHRTLTITGKGSARAVVALAPVTVAALEGYLDERTDGPLFTTRTGSRLDRATAFRMVRRLATAAGLEQAPSVGLHSLRHTFVTAALEAGVPLHTVQDAARHADPRTTRRYDRARHNLDQHATYAVAAYLSGP